MTTNIAGAWEGERLLASPSSTIRRTRRLLPPTHGQEVVLGDDLDPVGFQAIEDDLVFGHGPKYNSQKFEYFLHSDIFVFPTYYHNETFGLVNLEAMQFRLPVISTCEGGIPDVVDDGISGFLIDPKNSEALANKLEILIKNPKLRSAMGEAGYERYLKKFTLEIFENRLTEILKIA